MSLETVEEWKPVFDKLFSEYYEVSNLGRVRRIKDIYDQPINKILKPINSRDYRVVNLTLNGYSKRYFIHRLVAFAFIENNDKSKNFVNHINGIKSDNQIENLEWVSKRENSIHSLKTDSNKSQKVKYSQYDEFIQMVKDGKSRKEIADHFSIHVCRVTYLKKRLNCLKFQRQTKNRQSANNDLIKYYDSRNVLWKPVNIDLYKNYYYASELGEIKRYNKSINTGYIDRCEYYRVNLYAEGKQKTFQLHRLIAVTFLENIDNKPQVNHIDGNKLNNKVSNLEWVTPKENSQHAMDIGLNSTKKINKEVENQIINLTNNGYTLAYISKTLNISAYSISRIKKKHNISKCINKSKYHHFLPQDIEDQIIKLSKEGIKIKTISEQLNIGIKIILRIRRKYNIQKDVPKIIHDQINQLYKEGLSCYKIAKKLKLCPQTIYNHLDI